MVTRRPWSFVAALGLALWVGSALAPSSARGQHTPDPYNIVGEFNSQYEPFMFAREPGPEGVIPNQNRLRDRSGFRTANRFQNYMNDAESLDGELDTGANFRRSGAGTRYFDAFRKYDEGFGRVYRPNDKADQAFYNDLDERNQKYFEARREQDPKKRAQLLREYNLEKLRAARSLSSSRTNFERTRETSRTGRRGGSGAVDTEGDELFDRGRGIGGTTANRRPSTSDSLDTLPPLRSPRAATGSDLSGTRSLRSGRTTAPAPPTSRTTGGLGTSSRPSTLSVPSTTSDLPSSVLERSEAYDEPRLVRPSTRTAPPPPR